MASVSEQAPRAGARVPARAVRAARLRALRRANWPSGFGAVLWLVIVLVPFYSVLVNSVAERNNYLDHGPLAPPSSFTLENFRLVLEGGFARYLLNTAIVTAGSVGLVLLVALPAAYAVVRSPHPFVGVTFRLFLLGLAVPAQAVIIPVYLLITRMHLYDTLIAVILPTAAFALPLSMVVLAGSLRDVPRELYEAMALDGAGTFRMLRSLVLPMSRSGVIVVAIYTGQTAWNGVVFPLVVTQSESIRTLTLGLWNFQGQFGVNVPGLMAAVLLSLLPFLFLYVFARRWITAGLAGAGGR